MAKGEKRYILKNPLKGGYSMRTITANILEMRAAGVPVKQATAAAYDMARKAWRKVHKTGQFPKHLKVLKKAVSKNPRFKTGRKSATRKTGRAHRGVVEQDTSASYIIETSDKHAGIIKQNPTPGRVRRAVTKAIKLYSDFTGHDPKFVDEWEIAIPDAAMQVGKITGIMYTTKMDGRQQEFLHEFSGKSRPILAASADGRQLLILGGDYHFSDRGIIDGQATFSR